MGYCLTTNSPMCSVTNLMDDKMCEGDIKVLIYLVERALTSDAVRNRELFLPTLNSRLFFLFPT